MAIVNNGTKNSLPDSQIPAGYTRPTVTEIVDPHYVSDLVLTVDKVTVDNAAPVTTMTQIITNASIGITKQIDDILAADYLASATIVAWTDWVGLANSANSNSGTGAALTDALVDFQCTVKLYVKAT